MGVSTSSKVSFSTSSQASTLSLVFTACAVLSSVLSTFALAASFATATSVEAFATPWYVASTLACVLAAALVMLGPYRFYKYLLATAALLVPLYLVPVLAWSTPRAFTAWLHAGMASDVAAGLADPSVDLRFNWPTGYQFMYSLSQSLGVSVLDMARFWPVVAVSVTALAVALLAYSFGASPRARFLAAAVFLVVSWVGQDYMSPQSLAFVFFLAALALMVAMLRGVWPKSWPSWVVLAALAVATLLTHQYTFLVLVLSAFVLGLFRTGRFLLPFAVGAGVAGLVYNFVFVSFTTSQWSRVRTGLGDPLYALSRGALDRVGSSDLGLLRTVVVADRLVLSAFVLALAVLSALLAARATASPATSTSSSAFPAKVSLALLAGVVVLGLVLPYGGESLLRVFLFTVPLAAVATAVWLDNTRFPFLLVPVLLVSAVLMVPARFGNDEFERFSPQAVEAVQFAYQNTSPQDRFLLLDYSLPTRQYSVVDRQYLMPSLDQLVNLDRLVVALTSGPTSRGVLVTSPQASTSRAFNRGAGLELYQQLTDRLSNDPRFVLLASFGDADVWGLR